jgi:hypothetical protein
MIMVLRSFVQVENRNREEMEMEKESGMGVICPMRSVEREI